MYIGKTESSQRQRDAQTHFRSGKTGSSTVRRTLGALLRDTHELRPIPRSERDRAKGRRSHFKFDQKSEDILTQWMASSLSLSFYEHHDKVDELADIEKPLIAALVPPLNLDHNPLNPFREIIRAELRSCRNLAYGSRHAPRKQVLKSADVPVTNLIAAPGQKGKYRQYWQELLPSIKAMIADDKPGRLQLDKRHFELLGNRKDYSFNIQYVDGNVTNNLSGSAVARDLDHKIRASSDIRPLLAHGAYKIRMGKDFILEVSTT